mgnify:CR=1 FL=1
MIVSEKNQVTYQRVLSEFGLAPHQFLMVGNSLISDISPVLQIGGYAIHMPYAVTWALEHDEHFVPDDDRMAVVDSAQCIPAAVHALALKAARVH